jgi:hypothetical protein
MGENLKSRNIKWWFHCMWFQFGPAHRVKGIISKNKWYYNCVNHDLLIEKCTWIESEWQLWSFWIFSRNFCEKLKASNFIQQNWYNLFAVVMCKIWYVSFLLHKGFQCPVILLKLKYYSTLFLYVSYLSSVIQTNSILGIVMVCFSSFPIPTN